MSAPSEGGSKAPCYLQTRFHRDVKHLILRPPASVPFKFASYGVRTHAELPPVDLKSTPLTTRANWHLMSRNRFDIVCHRCRWRLKSTTCFPFSILCLFSISLSVSLFFVLIGGYWPGLVLGGCLGVGWLSGYWMVVCVWVVWTKLWIFNAGRGLR
jgi:hypothetical protein